MKKDVLQQSGRKIRSALLLLFLFLTSFTFLNAQVPVTGTVTSEEDGGPIPGVNIICVGTTNGAITKGFDGENAEFPRLGNGGSENFPGREIRELVGP